MQTPRTGLVEQDLGPLAWVQEELRKSLESAIRLTRRFVLEAQESGDSDLAALDTSPLRMAKQQLHQSSGALDMVDQPQVGLVLRAMEAAVQHYIRQPQDFTLAAVQTLEKTSFALLEYLDVVLAGKAVLPVALFTQYRNVQALSGQDAKVHPADLWPAERRLREPQWPAKVAPVAYGPEARSVLDTAVLQIVKSADKPAALRLRQLSLGLAEGQSTPGWRTFWKIAAGFFDAFAHGLLKDDNYTKRVASRVLMVYASAAKNQEAGIDRLLQDMLFFCSQAGDPAAGKAPVLQAVRNAFGLQRHQSVDYEQTHFGRFDPAVLAQARKRLAAVTELWSALVGGDRQKIKPVADQFSLVTDSLLHLHPGSRPLEQALTQLTQRLEQTGQLPSTEIAMEVATAVLYLQAAFNSLDISEADMTAHTQILAQRLQRVMDGHPPAPLEAWMEQLYHQVSDQQTMGSVVGELRKTLSEAEKHLDQYFRTPEDVKVLQPVGSLLAQIRGVLSVLGLDPAAQAMGQMRRYVEGLQTGTIASEERQAVFDKLGNSLGVLGFLIDMLSYQPNMARKLYRYDEAAGELKLTMGRARQRQTDEAASAPAAPAAPVLAVRAEQAISTLVPNVQVEPAAAPHPAPSPAETTAPAASAPAPAPTPTPVPELTPVPAPELPPVPVPVP
ncbi:MAG: hybrid sensor histidine kinase/response regulator, partial [Comamonas sp.]|nr:hybrid sensor histidine kinase/response regulator [Comamonas sp.]